MDAPGLCALCRTDVSGEEGFRGVMWFDVAMPRLVGPLELFVAFGDRTLPKTEWTHEAHLIVCWHALQEMPAKDAIPYLRGAISAYNESTGTPNTESSGYHETLTRYYVGAVAQLAKQPLDDLYRAASCRRDAPLRHWSREALFSTAARLDWLEPDLVDLPWTPPSE